ncbi:hypothetical protein R1T08_24240 [Streptomyces sp. SBC-4]|nr:hypothetical protein [Streptomyces sp. SBC-4]MDV5147201.1 hypothetical protein [Streptomyces sp. SBC-4]
MSITVGIHDPLHIPALDRPEWVPPLDMARRLARQMLDKHATANIHDADEMLRAAVGLEHALRDLLNALDAEECR